ncbi:MAG: septum formation initiator family protein [Vicinamibacterales bacterium]
MDQDTPHVESAAPAPPAMARGRRLIRIALVIVTGVVLVDAIAGEKGLFELMRARDERQALEAQVRAMRLENQRLLEQARRYREDPATIEELARRDLGMIKPGEKLFIIRDLPPAAPR